jgi:hypothetical protein
VLWYCSPILEGENISHNSYIVVKNISIKISEY